MGIFIKCPFSYHSTIILLSGINVKTSASKMKSLLQAYFDVGSVDVERTGSCSGYQWDITWTSKGGSQPLIEVKFLHLASKLI